MIMKHDMPKSYQTSHNGAFLVADTRCMLAAAWEMASYLPAAAAAAAASFMSPRDCSVAWWALTKAQPAFVPADADMHGTARIPTLSS